MDTFTGLLRRWFSQEVARKNAAQAAVRLQHRRRQLDDLDEFLAAQHHDPARLRPPSTHSVHRRRTRPGPR